MNKEELSKAFVKYAQGDIESAHELITELFLGISMAKAKSANDKEIIIKGSDGRRLITIHRH